MRATAIACVLLAAFGPPACRALHDRTAIIISPDQLPQIEEGKLYASLGSLNLPQDHYKNKPTPYRSFDEARRAARRELLERQRMKLAIVTAQMGLNEIPEPQSTLLALAEAGLVEAGMGTGMVYAAWGAPQVTHSQESPSGRVTSMEWWGFRGGRYELTGSATLHDGLVVWWTTY